MRKRLFRALASLLALCLMTASGARAERTLTLTFAGDCTIGCEDALRTRDFSLPAFVERYGDAYFFQNVKELFDEDDFTVVNFEGVLQENTYNKVNKTYNFRGPSAYAGILAAGGVEVAGLENNHTGDYGRPGLRNTLAALEAYGIKTFANLQPVVLEKDGLRVAVMGMTRNRYFSHGAMFRETIARLRAEGVNAVVCYLHFGQEYAKTHNASQEQMARSFIDAGADFVVGAHPHVVQGVELYRNRYIVYSLGNFVFGGNAKIRALECLVARLTLRFDDDGAPLGQRLSLYAAHASGNATNNNYQPRLVSGADADGVFALVDADSTTLDAPAIQENGRRDYAERHYAQDADESPD